MLLLVSSIVPEMSHLSYGCCPASVESLSLSLWCQQQNLLTFRRAPNQTFVVRVEDLALQLQVEPFP